MWKNTEATYGYLAKILHWGSAITIFGLFALGYWMVDLDYYHQWYKTAPHWHKSIGILLLLATVARLIWRWYNPAPNPILTHSTIIRRTAQMVHFGLYALLFILMISGYLISTADSRPIAVFNWFAVPALGALFANQEDVAGIIHQYSAYTLMVLSLLHALAAAKHHIIDKDDTLKRMIT